MELTSPLTLGSHGVTANGAVALKLKALFRVNVPLDPLIWVKVPTAYMVVPHCTSWRICSVTPVATSVGVPATGVEDTGPVWASAGVPASTASERQQTPAVAPAT